MIKIIQSFHVKASVIAIHSDEKTIYFTDTDGNLHTVCRTQWNRSEVSLIQEATPLHRFQKGSSFSQNGHVAYSAKINNDCAICLKLPPIADTENEMEATDPMENTSEAAIGLRGHDQRAEVMTFCGAKGQYLLTGGTDGKVYMYSTQTGKIIMSLKPKPDYISHITVDKRGGNLAYSAYDKSLIVLNIRHQKERLNTFAEDAIEHSFFYNDSKSLYAIGREGNSYVYHFKSDETSKKALFPSWPSCCVVDSSGRFAIVGGRNGTIYVVKLSDNTLFSSFKLDQKGISSLHVEDTYLFIGFESGWVYMIDMHAFIDDFSQALNVKNFKTAKKCLDNNLFLAIHPMSEMFQEAWEEMLKEIINQFSTGNAASALEFATPFLSDDEHKKEFEFLLQKQKDFEKFAILVQKKEFQEAFGMLERAPYLEKTDSARKLELYFTKSFAEAKKLIAADPLRNGPKAQEILKPFCVVPIKKEMIHSLQKNYEIYLKADSLIKEKQFREYFNLTEKFDFLTLEEVYKKICSLAEASIAKIKKLIEEGKYDDAFSGIKQVAVFLPYKEQLMELAKEIQLRQKLLEAIQSNAIQTAYELVVAYPILESMAEFVAYDETFDEVLSNAMISVANGEIKQVQQILLPYAGISIFKPKIRECIRQATFNKLGLLLAAKSLAVAQSIAAYYLKEFGKDDEFEKLLKHYGVAS
jgi:5'(3')-deoxyribonucleotidase